MRVEHVQGRDKTLTVSGTLNMEVIRRLEHAGYIIWYKAGTRILHDSYQEAYAIKVAGCYVVKRKAG